MCCPSIPLRAEVVDESDVARAHAGRKSKAPHQHRVSLEETFEAEADLNQEIGPKHPETQARGFVGAEKVDYLRKHGNNVHEPCSPDNVFPANFRCDLVTGHAQCLLYIYVHYTAKQGIVKYTAIPGILIETDMQEKRFQLSREDFAKERVRGLQNAIEIIQRERPEIVSLTLFGSLVKGTSHPHSDIDLNIYVDVDALMEKRPELDDTVLVDKKYDYIKPKEKRLWASSFRWKDFRPDIQGEYVRYVTDTLLKAIPNIDNKQLKDMYVQPLSEKIVDDMLSEIRASYEQYPDGAEPAFLTFAPSPILEGAEAREMSERARVEPNQVLYGLFFLDAGGGLRKYRKQIIDRLSQWGELGENVWSSLINATEGWEQKLNFDLMPSAKRYPRTLKAARALYGR